MANNDQLGLKLADSPFGLPKLRGLTARVAVDLSTIDPVLTQPFRQRDRVNAEFLGSLLLLFAGPDECDRSGTVVSLSKKAIT